jgi:L-asparaginase
VNEAEGKPRIAVFSGPTATIQLAPPLVTSNKARSDHGLAQRTDELGRPLRYDALRPQRIAAPVTVYVEQFSAHPMERDAGHLYGPPDGYVDGSGRFHAERRAPGDVPVYEVTLRPEDGLYPLPYMARQADGRAWDEEGTGEPGRLDRSRQPFFADGARLFEEIDRLGVGDSGDAGLLSSRAVYEFHRVAPPAGYTQGQPEVQRTDVGAGDIPTESLGEHFFPHRPTSLRRDPSMGVLARVTSKVQRAMASGRYAGAIWLEGSPTVEETSYWLNLLIDTKLPMVGTASQRPHGAVGNDGDRNVIDAVDYILSRVWADAQGRDDIGMVVIQDEQVFTARDVQKGDARPGGYVATGGHGGIVGTMGRPGPPALTFRPVKRHTYRSALTTSRIPPVVHGVLRDGGELRTIQVEIRDAQAELVPAAIPKVTIVKHAHYLSDRSELDADAEVDILARIEKNLRDAPLAGFVAEGAAPYGTVSQPVHAALRLATMCGMPVVKVGRGNAEGNVDPTRDRLAIAGSNLTATKARLLLMGCLMRFGALPPASDPRRPSRPELGAISHKLSEYQDVFDTH